MLRILNGCLYCPALVTAVSVRSEYIQLLCAVLALSVKPQSLDGDEMFTGGGSDSQEQVLLLSVARVNLRRARLWSAVAANLR